MLSSLVVDLSTIVDFAFSAYLFIVVGRILIRWTFLEQDHPVFDYAVVRFVFKITEMPMAIACSIFPRNNKGRCWGPFALLVVLFIMKIEIVSRLEKYALTLS